MKRAGSWSLGASLAVHGAALLLVVRFFHPAPPPPAPPLEVAVRFLLVEEAPPTAPAPTPMPSVPEAPPPPKTEPPPAITPAPAPMSVQPVTTTKPDAPAIAIAHSERHRASQPAPAQPAARTACPAATGSPAAGPTTDAHPRYAVNPPPRYPPDALRQRQQGIALLRVKVAADGSVSGLSLHHTSGFSALDDAAMTAVRRWKFEPARKAGLPVAAEVAVPVRFQMKG